MASVQVQKSLLILKASSEQDKQQTDPDPVLYREEDMSDLPSQCTEDKETFRQILNLLTPARNTPPRSSTTIWVLDDAKRQQELRQRGPLAMLPLSLYLKDAFKKFEQDFQVANLQEGNSIKSTSSTSKRTNYRN